jgi:ribosome-binding factor A
MSHRKLKLEEQIRRIVADLIIKEIKDPRLGFVTVTKADLNRDMTHVKVGISVLGNPHDIRKSLEGLRSAEGFIQAKLGKALQIRMTPHLRFVLDSSVVDAVEMVGLIESVNKNQTQSEESKKLDESEK